MKYLFIGTVSVVTLFGAAVANASECNRSSLSGDWFLSSGGQLVCEVTVSERGEASGECRVAHVAGSAREPVPLKGRFLMNRRCEVSLRIADVDFVGEARGWTTQRSNRIDMMGGVLGWKVEEGVSTSWKVEEGTAIIGFMANRRNR